MKRITLFAGHYGSGKTNIAVNYAMKLKNDGLDVAVYDLDIVNPYFRTKDSEKELNEMGIELVSSAFANSNVDLPSLPQQMYRTVCDKSKYAVMDIGGDDAGAIALGRFAPFIKQEDSYEMAYVLNFYRPLCRTAEDALEIMADIERAASLKFTCLVHNSNLGQETASEDILVKEAEAKRLSEMTGLPVMMTTVEKSLYEKIKDKTENAFPLTLQKKII